MTLTFQAMNFVRRLYRRRIRRREDDVPQPGWVRLTMDDGTTVSLPLAALELAQEIEFRRAARGAMQPLRREGVDEARLEYQDETVRITADEAPAFDIPDVPDELVLDNEREAVVRLATVAFQEGNKWRVAEGDVPFWVDIADTAFLQRVETDQEQFSAGDQMRVRLRTQQWTAMDGAVRVERTVTQVLDHVRGPRAVPLPFESDEP